MASISSPFPLSSTPLSQNVYISTVINSASEVVVAADGEGLSIHHVRFLVAKSFVLILLDCAKSGVVVV